MRSSKDVDVRADLWAIGAILHALMTGAPPFPGFSMMEIYDLILAGAPPLRTARPEAPAGGTLRARPRAQSASGSQRAGEGSKGDAPSTDPAGAPTAPEHTPKAAASKALASAPGAAEAASVSQSGTGTPVVTAARALRARRWMPALVVAAGAMGVAGAVALWPKARPHVDPAAPATAGANSAAPLATTVVVSDGEMVVSPAPEPPSSAQQAPAAGQPKPASSAPADAAPAPRATASAAVPPRSRGGVPASTPALATTAPAESKPIPAASQPAPRHGIY
jgi:serine/threonine protein kinase